MRTALTAGLPAALPDGAAPPTPTPPLPPERGLPDPPSLFGAQPSFCAAVPGRVGWCRGAARTGPRRRRHRDGGLRRWHRVNTLTAGGAAGVGSGAHLIAAATRPQPASHHVLPSVAATCPAHTQAPQPSLVVQSLNVHGLLSAQFPPGTETLHDLCLGLPSSSIPHLLQLLGELLLVSLHRIPVARIGS